jgi:hypothetical protein
MTTLNLPELPEPDANGCGLAWRVTLDLEGDIRVSLVYLGHEGVTAVASITEESPAHAQAAARNLWLNYQAVHGER